jgi:putative redox protein
VSGVDRREVRLSRLSRGRYRASNARGGVIEFGLGEENEFTPVELLLAAIAGCSAIDVDLITSKRAEPSDFEVAAAGRKIRDDNGNRLVDLRVDFQVRFADDEAGNRAESVLRRSVQQSHDRLCTVTRTVEVGSPVTVAVRGEDLTPPAR